MGETIEVLRADLESVLIMFDKLKDIRPGLGADVLDQVKGDVFAACQGCMWAAERLKKELS